MKRLRIILAIESYIVRKGITAVLNRIPGIQILRETGNLNMLEQYLDTHESDFIIICNKLFGMATGIYVKNSRLIDQTIIVYRDRTEERNADFKESIFLDDSRDVVIAKIDRLLTPYFKNQNNPVKADLSDRERTIIRYVASGMTNREIAEKLFLSAHTVMTHRKNIGRKLNIKSASGLTVFAIVNNIISIDEIAGLRSSK